MQLIVVGRRAGLQFDARRRAARGVLGLLVARLALGGAARRVCVHRTGPAVVAGAVAVRAGLARRAGGGVGHTCRRPGRVT